MRYQAQILDTTSFSPTGEVFPKKTCGHKHTTTSGALTCLMKLSIWGKDGTHNDWAHFGTIREISTGSSLPLEYD